MEQLRIDGVRLSGIFNTLVTVSLLWGFTTLQFFFTSLWFSRCILSCTVSVCCWHRASIGLTIRPELLATISVTRRSSPVGAKVKYVFNEQRGGWWSRGRTRDTGSSQRLLFLEYLTKNKHSSEYLLTLLVPLMSSVNIHQNMPRANSESLHFPVMLRVLKGHTHSTTTKHHSSFPVYWQSDSTLSYHQPRNIPLCLGDKVQDGCGLHFQSPGPLQLYLQLMENTTVGGFERCWDISIIDKV